MQQTIILILDFPMQPFIIHLLMHAHAYGALSVCIFDPIRFSVDSLMALWLLNQFYNVCGYIANGN